MTALTLTAQDGLALTDAGALGYLPALTTLTIQGGQMPDLEGLRDHPNLQSLTLIDCRTTDLSPLADCAGLNEVTLIRSEGSTDASHASDLGFMRQADIFEPVLRAALGK